MSRSIPKTRWRARAAVLAMALLSLPALGRVVSTVPEPAFRFVRYMAASGSPELKATMWERVVFSWVLATESDCNGTRG